MPEPFNGAHAANPIALLERRLARSERARAEAEALLENKSQVLAQANQKMAARKAKLQANLDLRTRQLLDAQRVAGFGTLIWDMEERKLEVSDQVKVLFSIPPNKKIINHITLIKNIDIEDRSAAAKWIYRKLHKKAKSGEILTTDLKLFLLRIPTPQSTDTTHRWLLCTADFEKGEHGKLGYIFATVQDVTAETLVAQESAELRLRDEQRLFELEKLNAQLTEARENAERANSAKSRFLAMMSHDIRTPLNGVIGMLALMAHDSLPEEQSRKLEIARASGQQLRVLLDDIIDLSRAEAGKLQLNVRATAIKVLLGNSASFWRHPANDKGISIELHAEPSLPDWVLTDPVRLRQLIDNLVSNAIKYTDKGNIRIEAGYNKNGKLRFAVVDTGIGIPPLRQNELFNDFGQLQLLGGERGGAGLGLAICRRIVDVMQGKIGVSDTDSGSCFWFEIPVTPIDASATASETAIRPLVCRNGTPVRVLVAEDIETNRIVVEGHLRKMSCDVTLVENGRQAVEAVANGDFNLVILDMAMPEMNGAEATQAIRAMECSKSKLPVVALTAFARPEELAPMFEAGADDCASKPIVSEELYAVLHKVLKQHKII